MSTNSNKLALSMPADGDTSWGDEIRNAFNTLEEVGCPDYTYWVSPAFTTADLFPNGAPADRRHFDTIQGAIDAVEGETSHEYLKIYVFPALYEESLTVEKSLGLVGLGGVNIMHPGGGVLPEVQGQGTSPAVIFNPEAGETHGLSFSGFRFSHAYTTTGSPQSWPYWIHFSDQGSGNYGSYINRLVLHNCHMRLDTAPDVFTYGIHGIGFSHIAMNLCTFRFPDADMTYPIRLDGNVATGKEAELFMKRCETDQWGSANPTITMANGASGLYYRCGSVRTRGDIVQFGAFGTNSLNGLNDDSEVTQYANAVGAAFAGNY